MLGMLLTMSLGGCGGGCQSVAVDDPKLAEKPRREDAELSDYAKEWGEKMARVRAGEAVDFYGDGSKFRVWHKDGVRYSESIGPPNNPYRSTSEVRPDGTEIDRYDAEGDGILESEIQRTPGREVQLYNRNRAGFFNERLTLTTLETGMIHRILSKRTSKDEEWKAIEDSVVPALRGQPAFEFKNNLPPRRNDLKKNTHESFNAALTSFETAGTDDPPSE